MLYRLQQSCVADPIFTGVSYINVADIAIFMGLLLMLISRIIVKGGGGIARRN